MINDTMQYNKVELWHVGICDLVLGHTFIHLSLGHAKAAPYPGLCRTCTYVSCSTGDMKLKLQMIKDISLQCRQDPALCSYLGI